jgi:hypothetical protein
MPSRESAGSCRQLIDTKANNQIENALEALGDTDEVRGFLSLIFILRGIPSVRSRKELRALLGAQERIHDHNGKRNDPPPEKAGSRTRKGK